MWNFLKIINTRLSTQDFGENLLKKWHIYNFCFSNCYKIDKLLINIEDFILSGQIMWTNDGL